MFSLDKMSSDKNPSDTVDSIVGELNHLKESPPFIVISETVDKYSKFVMPTLWSNYFSSDSVQYDIIYEARFDDLIKIESAKDTLHNISVVINKGPIQKNRKTEILRHYLPIEISSNARILPYDPANSFELLTIISMALKVNNNSCIIYASAHDDIEKIPKSNVVVCEDDVMNGLYLYRRAESNMKTGRILAGGRSLLFAIKMSEWLKDNIGLLFEVWSCPSYTIVSREVEMTEQKNIYSEGGEVGNPHVIKSLNDGLITIAMTQYDSLISEQISKNFYNGFLALGFVKSWEGKEKNEVISRILYHLMRNEFLSKEAFRKAMISIEIK